MQRYIYIYDEIALTSSNAFANMVSGFGLSPLPPGAAALVAAAAPEKKRAKFAKKLEDASDSAVLSRAAWVLYRLSYSFRLTGSDRT